MIVPLLFGVYFAVGLAMLVVALHDPENNEDWSSMEGVDQISYAMVFLFLWPLIMIPD